jgi:hypothetical protein
MNTKARSELSELFEEWRTDDRKLATSIAQIRDWMVEVNQLGIPHFGETAAKLRPLRSSLETHFLREDAMLAKLAELYPSNSPEVMAFKRQTGLDHHALLTRLDKLLGRLGETDPQFPSWTAAMDEVDVFFEAMEQHERQESDRVGMLMPTEGGEADQLF